MSIQRYTATQIETAMLQAMGYSASTLAPWASSANLYLRINDYMQSLPTKLAMMVQALVAKGAMKPLNGTPRFDMWKTSANLTASSGSQTVYFPADYDHWASFYDNTNKRTIEYIEDVDRFHVDLRDQAAGPPEYIEILGFADNSGTWQRQGKLYPATATGVTPSVSCTYWRIPAKISSGTDYPDIDPKYQSLALYGPICEISRSTGKEHERYLQREEAMLTEIAMSARAV